MALFPIIDNTALGLRSVIAGLLSYFQLQRAKVGVARLARERGRCRVSLKAAAYAQILRWVRFRSRRV